MIQQKNKEYEKKVMKNQNLTLPPKAPHTRHFVAKNLEGEDITLEHAKQIHYKEQIVQETALENLQVLGRVIWFGRRM